MYEASYIWTPNSGAFFSLLAQIENYIKHIEGTTKFECNNNITGIKAINE
jgi:hypothetical protein